MKTTTWRLLTIAGLFACLSATTGCLPVSQTEGDYTILLSVVTGPDHATHIKQVQTAAEQHTNWKHMFAVTSATNSSLYWGRYKNMDDAQPFLKEAKAFVLPTNNTRIFATAMIKILPGKIDAPPEWDLANVDPTKWDPKNGMGYITLMVGVYYDEPDAKDERGRPAPYYGYTHRRAVDVCKELRANGYEAYYYFSTGRSLVSVGIFPPQSMKVKYMDNPHNKSGQKSKIRYCEIVDPQLAKLKNEFPDLAVNERGVATKVRNNNTGQIEMKKQESYPIRLREVRQDSGGGNNTEINDLIDQEPWQGR